MTTSYWKGNAKQNALAEPPKKRGRPRKTPLPEDPTTFALASKKKTALKPAKSSGKSGRLSKAVVDDDADMLGDPLNAVSDEVPHSMVPAARVTDAPPDITMVESETIRLTVEPVALDEMLPDMPRTEPQESHDGMATSATGNAMEVIQRPPEAISIAEVSQIADDTSNTVTKAPDPLAITAIPIDPQLLNSLPAPPQPQETPLEQATVRTSFVAFIITKFLLDFTTVFAAQKSTFCDLYKSTRQCVPPAPRKRTFPRYRNLGRHRQHTDKRDV